MTVVPVELSTRPVSVLPDTAAADLLLTDVAGLGASIDRATDRDVDRVLSARRRSAADLAVLLSAPAALRLDELAEKAHALTVQRFGRVVRLFAPLYLSNECVSVCTYCGFSAGNDIARRTLSPQEAVEEAAELVSRGMRHLLLVAGEHARIVSKTYLIEVVSALAPIVPQLSIEVQVWDTDFYRDLVAAGADGLIVYQETYDPATYAAVHVKGKKRNDIWRLGAPDRGGDAGMRRLGIGALLGLHDDWRTEALSVAVHAEALCRRWWRSEVTVAVPRLRPAAGVYEPAAPVSDRELVQLVCAMRLCLPDVGITLSTREPASLRDLLVEVGVTQMSAGSHTEPGGYAAKSDAEPQFEVADDRSPSEVAAVLRRAGYDPVWKDWQRA